MARGPLAHSTILLLAGCAAMSGRPPTGASEQLTSRQKAALAKIRTSVSGQIVWSSSRFGNHDVLIMNTDGSAVRRVTSGPHVDWYPRWSPSGQLILFARSRKAGWVSEKDANRLETWDTYAIKPDGSGMRLVVKDASWATWIDDETIMFARKQKVLTRRLTGGDPSLIVDSAAVQALGGADLQSPHRSPDGKYLSITLRGKKRETGVYSIADRSWTPTGQGCQVTWFPRGRSRIVWVNPSGNGGSELFSVPLADGRPTKAFSYDEMRFMDIPGRRSHEYFPDIERGGRWMVWAATRRGHDHDIADYEIYIWKLGAPKSEATRLTFHSANDRWPHLLVTRPSPSTPKAAAGATTRPAPGS